VYYATGKSARPTGAAGAWDVGAAAGKQQYQL
jgi:hypothetical protein